MDSCTFDNPCAYFIKVGSVMLSGVSGVNIISFTMSFFPPIQTHENRNLITSQTTLDSSTMIIFWLQKF